MVRQLTQCHRTRLGQTAAGIFIKADAASLRHQHGCHVVFVRHHTCDAGVAGHGPVGGVEPLACAAAHPCDRALASDIGAGCAGAGHRVIRGIGTTQTHAVDADGFVGVYVFAVKTGRANNVDSVAAQWGVGGCDRGHRAAVVHAVHTRKAHAQSTYTYAACTRGTGGQGVVAQGCAAAGREVAAGQGRAHAVGRQHISVVVDARRLGDAGPLGNSAYGDKTIQAVVACIERGIGVAVIGLLNRAHQSGRQQFGRDVGAGAACGGSGTIGVHHLVVGRIAAI